jgi:HAMP domain-containing protein
MTIRYLAQELYRLTQKVEELERARTEMLEGASIEERNRLEAELSQTKKELGRIREVLESKKEKTMV